MTSLKKFRYSPYITYNVKKGIFVFEYEDTLKHSDTLEHIEDFVQENFPDLITNTVYIHDSWYEIETNDKKYSKISKDFDIGMFCFDIRKINGKDYLYIKDSFFKNKIKDEFYHLYLLKYVDGAVNFIHKNGDTLDNRLCNLQPVFA